ncbi:FeoA family protein [Atopobiaceae bacterium 24-176]
MEAVMEKSSVRRCGPAVPLSMLAVGESAVVAAVKGSESVVRHLATLGFVEGAPVRVAGQAASGTVVQVKGSQLALDKGTARRVLCAPRA